MRTSDFLREREKKRDGKLEDTQRYSYQSHSTDLIWFHFKEWKRYELLAMRVMRYIPNCLLLSYISEPWVHGSSNIIWGHCQALGIDYKSQGDSCQHMRCRNQGRNVACICLTFWEWFEEMLFTVSPSVLMELGPRVTLQHLFKFAVSFPPLTHCCPLLKCSWAPFSNPFRMSKSTSFSQPHWETTDWNLHFLNYVMATLEKNIRESIDESF